MHKYQVQINADFIIKGVSPGQIRESLIRIVRREGFKDINFDIKIERERLDKESVVVEDTNDNKESKKESKEGDNNKLQRGRKRGSGLHVQRKVAKKVRKTKN